jgi:hypothetical protein
MTTTTFDLSSITAITFYQYLVLDKSDNTAYAVLTIQENTPVEFSSSPLGADAESEGEDFGDYLSEIRYNTPELCADIAHAIASEMIDYTDIKFVKFNSFQIPISRKDSNGSFHRASGSIHNNYGEMLDEKKHENLFSLAAL